MILTDLNCNRGAPMGRHGFDHTDGPVAVELERVPLIDGGYDVGGAYWGCPDDLWAYQHIDVDGETQLFGTLRAEHRDIAMARLLKENPNWTILPETGSVIEQTIKFLQAWVAREHPDAGHEETDDQIEELEGDLLRIRRRG